MTHFISEENLKWMIQQCKMFCWLFPPLKVFFPRETPTFSTFRRKRPFSFEPETVDLRGLSKLMWLWHSMSENMQGIWSHIPSVLFHSYVNCVQKFLKILKSDLALSPSLINKPDWVLIFCYRGQKSRRVVLECFDSIIVSNNDCSRSSIRWGLWGLNCLNWASEKIPGKRTNSRTNLDWKAFQPYAISTSVTLRFMSSEFLCIILIPLFLILSNEWMAP